VSAFPLAYWRNYRAGRLACAVMPELPITEPAETTIEEPPDSLERLQGATSDEEVARVAADFPECLTAWAELGERALAAGRTIEAYAYFRVGYHRGLDRIRRAGWRGSGRVPWRHEPNRGFLRSLRGLGQAAALIGEGVEAERCKTFLGELSPDTALSP
jgi:hypothetical protein